MQRRRRLTRTGECERAAVCDVVNIVDTRTHIPVPSGPRVDRRAAVLWTEAPGAGLGAGRLISADAALRAFSSGSAAAAFWP